MYVFKGPSTKDVRQIGEGGGFDISDIPGRGWFVKVRNSKISQSSSKLKLEIIIYRRSRFQYESIHI